LILISFETVQVFNMSRPEKSLLFTDYSISSLHSSLLTYQFAWREAPETFAFCLLIKKAGAWPSVVLYRTFR